MTPKTRRLIGLAALFGLINVYSGLQSRIEPPLPPYYRTIITNTFQPHDTERLENALERLTNRVPSGLHDQCATNDATRNNTEALEDRITHATRTIGIPSSLYQSIIAQESAGFIDWDAHDSIAPLHVTGHGYKQTALQHRNGMIALQRSRDAGTLPQDIDRALASLTPNQVLHTDFATYTPFITLPDWYDDDARERTLHVDIPLALIHQGSRMPGDDLKSMPLREYAQLDDAIFLEKLCDISLQADVATHHLTHLLLEAKRTRGSYAHVPAQLIASAYNAGPGLIRDTLAAANNASIPKDALASFIDTYLAEHYPFSHIYGTNVAGGETYYASRTSP